MKMTTKKLGLSLGLLPVLFQPANAAEWLLDPQVASNASYTDNLQLTANNEVEVFSASIEPSLEALIRQPLWEISSFAKIIYRDYVGRDDLDKTNLYSKNTFDYKLTEKLTAGMIANYTYDTTLDSDFEDTGLIFRQVRRESWRAGPTVNYTLSEKSYASLGYTYSQLIFDGDTSSQPNLAESISENAYASYSYILDEKNTIFTQLSYLNYQTTDDLINSGNTRIEVNQPSISLGWNSNWDETLSMSNSIGLRNAKTEQEGLAFNPITDSFVPTSNESSSLAFTYSSQITKQFERSSLSFNASQDANPSSVAGLSENTSVSLTYGFRFTEKMKTSIKGRFIHAETVQGTSNSGSINDDTLLFEPRITWKIAQNWAFSANYQYIKRNNKNLSNDITGNTVFARIVFNDRNKAISR